MKGRITSSSKSTDQGLTRPMHNWTLRLSPSLTRFMCQSSSTSSTRTSSFLLSRQRSPPCSLLLLPARPPGPPGPRTTPQTESKRRHTSMSLRTMGLSAHSRPRYVTPSRPVVKGSTPPTRIRPLGASFPPDSSRKSVVLPAPLAPMRSVREPEGRSKLTS